MESFQVDDTDQLSLYDAIEQMPPELSDFAEAHLKNTAAVTGKPSLDTPDVSPARDYQTGDVLSDSVNLAEFFSVFGPDVSCDDSSVQESNGRTDELHRPEQTAESVGVLGKVVRQGPESFCDGSKKLAEELPLMSKGSDKEPSELSLERSNLAVKNDMPKKTEVAQENFDVSQQCGSGSSAKKGLKAQKKKERTSKRNDGCTSNEVDQWKSAGNRLRNREKRESVDVVKVGRDAIEKRWSFGEQLDEYIRLHIMPFCLHEEHEPQKMYKSNGEVTANNVGVTEEISNLLTEISRAVETDEVGSAKNREVMADPESNTVVEATPDITMEDAGPVCAQEEVVIAVKNEKDKTWKRDLQLNHSTPVVLLPRILIEGLSSKPKQPLPTPNALKASSASRTGSKQNKRRRANSAFSTPGQDPGNGTPTMTSTPLTTATGPRKRGRPRKSQTKQLSSSLNMGTIETPPKTNGKPVAEGTNTSRPRRATSTSASYLELDTDVEDDDDCIIIESPLAKRSKQRDRKPKKRQLCVST